MKTKITLGLIAAACIFLSSCEQFGNSVVPSGSITEQVKNESNFDGISVSHAFNVYITFTEATESIRIEANENLHEYIEVKKSGSTLSIGLKDNINIRRGSATLNAYISAKNMSDFKASGASNIYMQNSLIENDVFIDLSGASNFSGYIEVSHLKANISGASDLKLTGIAKEVEFDASGASNLNDYGLTITNFEASLSGASSAHITVNNELFIEASGASDVHYKGTGIVKRQNLSGASNIRKVD